MILRSIAFLLVASACLAQTTGSTTASDSPEDIPALTTQANQGNADAQLKLGDAYLRGRGVTQNNAEAVRFVPGGC
jgi:TPR repeat protein